MKRLGATDIFGLLVLLILVFSGREIAGDPGLGWHLKIGQLMVEERFIPETGEFLDPPADADAWVHDQWLSDVGVELLRQTGGMPLIHAAAIFIFVFTFVGLVGLTVKQKGRSEELALIAALVATFNGSVQFILRPVLFSFLLFALVNLILQTKDSRVKWSLPVVFLIWANLHPAFVLGLALILIRAGSLWLDSERGSVWQLLSIALLSFLATLVNPYGTGLYENSIALAQSEYFMNLNVEWLSPTFDHMLFAPFFFSVMLVSIAGATAPKKISGYEWLTLLLFTFLALSSRRYIPFFGIIAAPFIASALSGVAMPRLCRFRSGTTVLLSSVAAVMLLFLSVLLKEVPRGSQDDVFRSWDFPAEAVALIPANSGRVFHSPNWGGFITYLRHPEVKPFIDDRNQLIGKARYEDYFVVRDGLPGWDKVMKRYDFSWALLYPADPLRLLLEVDASWEQVYVDDKALLFRKLR